MHVPDLETPRLHLRPMAMTDAPAVQKHFGRWNVMEQIGVIPWPYPSDGAETYLRGKLALAEAAGVYLWGLVAKDGPAEVAGAIEYRLAADEDDNRGFWLAEPLWGRGLMTEAVVATQDFVFLELGIDRLVVTNAVSNTASARIKARCGARRIDRVPGEYLSGDRLRDVWEIGRDDWLSRREDDALSRYRIGGR